MQWWLDASAVAVTAGDPTGIAAPQPGMGGLLPPFGDALLGQHLAQPGMLVVHVPSLLRLGLVGPAAVSALVAAGLPRMAPQPGPRIRHLPYAGARLFPIFGRWLLTAAVSLRPVTRDNPGEIGGRVASPTLVGRVEELQLLDAANQGGARHAVAHLAGIIARDRPEGNGGRKEPAPRDGEPASAGVGQVPNSGQPA